MTDERVYWLWLRAALGVGAPQTEELFAAYDGAKDIYDADTLSPALSLTAQQRRCLRNKDLTKATEELARLEQHGVWILTPHDATYRTLFEGMFAPPVMLYGKGDRFDPCDVPVVAVVGTRHHDENGAAVTRRFAAGLAAGGAVIVSGGAEGLDSHALEAALDAGGRCISFQACGIDVDYPKSVAPLRQRLLENGGMLLTEFPLGVPPLRHHFRIRNRLISAAACGTLVTQAPAASGALITAGWAREQGRDVFAVPGTVGVACCQGSNTLLKEGATLVTNASDILMEYLMRFPQTIDIEAAIAAEDRAGIAYFKARAATRMPVHKAAAVAAVEPPVMAAKVAQSFETTTAPVPCPDDASDEAKAIYAALADGAKTATELSMQTALPLGKVLSVITVLELRGIVRCGAGQRYALCTKA